MHIVLSGYYGFDNVGDDAILLSIIQALKKWENDIEITVLSNNPTATEQTYGVKAVNRWKMKEIHQLLKTADGLISGGGSLMQDQTGMKTIPYYAGVIQIAKWLKKPVFVYAQGMGPINHSLSKLIVRKTFNKVEQITVRDKASQTLLTEIGVRKETKIVPDPVMGLNGGDFHCEWLDQESLTAESYISVSVRDWPSTIAYKEKIAHSLDQLVRQGEQIVFLPMHGEHDLKTSQEVAALMQEKSLIAPSDLSIEEKIAVIGQSQLLIGMRLHSLIFSAIYATPFIAISYDPKIDAFADIVDQPVIGHVEKDDWNGVTLFERAIAMLESYTTVRENMRHAVLPLQHEATATAKLAIETFSK
ncbi:polysaccharide pyruvyl transferase CsaB [Lysinibacillus sphaericus]|uniref:CsaB protein n=3 Tax=Lysinibacillus TaxID=400634 RepID=B1HM76_LYSSC|nr:MULTISPECIES: polysaccharide pyruvyl transferase CsaB [Lysinibacillus]MBE5082053.1 polysaccharide pyruvyl transferase CsaB [Bacillus thuringiensis]ACA38648.1 CsaB protein [Lysinibacillus sphaericus C3-41]AMO31082.1 polysaccharide pyruvyl transferase CsaB [Lysinibacillus sphaericus]AMR89811.1 polysaccharide pyruvyl transferase CsaB [Lysinibacillus sphaericus]ANA47882.1 polysaccharide pyruvyl transferase CsaB [Lysinibacillus sphaericus]